MYDRDPKRFPDASLHAHLTYADVITRQELGVMDTTAITLCAENNIPVVVFNLFRPGNIARAIRGDDVGTRVGERWAPLEEAAPGGAAGGVVHAGASVRGGKKAKAKSAAALGASGR